MAKTKSQMPVSDNSTHAVAEALNAVLADSFALYLKTKNFHWHVSGPHFHDYHLLFDAQAGEIFETTDSIAERVRKIGSITLRSISDITRYQRIKDNNAPTVSPNDMFKELRDDNLSLVTALRDAKRIADETGDNATSGLVDQWTDLAEGRVWFLREASQRR